LTATAQIVERMTAYARTQYPNRTAPLTAIEAVLASTRMRLEEGLLLEERLVNGAKATPECRGAVHVFFAERETRKVPGLPPDTRSRPVRKAAVIGAGTMGGGIAICCANAGIPVTLVELVRSGRTIADWERSH
jgi:3-hydroxyacyl-CoA dehydrogenase